MTLILGISLFWTIFLNPLRDKFVLAALDEDFYPEPEGLEREIKKSMIDKKENENGEER